MRGMVEGLDSAVPLVLQLPAVYQEEEFTARFLTAFDAALAPVLATLDSLAAYVDPQLAPDDFVEWLASWVGVAGDVGTRGADGRALVSRAVRVHRKRGTAAGVQEAVQWATGAEVEVSESGAVTWSQTPGAPLPGRSEPAVRVSLVVDHPDAVDVATVRALVEARCPAHIPATIEIAGRDDRGGSR